MSRNKKRYINAIGAPKLALRLLVAGLFCLAFVKLALLRNDRIEKGNEKRDLEEEIASLRDEISTMTHKLEAMSDREVIRRRTERELPELVDIGQGDFFYITADAIAGTAPSAASGTTLTSDPEESEEAR